MGIINLNEKFIIEVKNVKSVPGEVCYIKSDLKFDKDKIPTPDEFVEFQRDFLKTVAESFDVSLADIRFVTEEEYEELNLEIVAVEEIV